MADVIDTSGRSNQRRDPALLAPPHHARGRHGGAAQAEAGEGALRRRRRTGFARRACIWPRRASEPSVLSISILLISQICSARSSTATDDVGRKETGLGRRDHRGHQSECRDPQVRDAPDQRRTRWRSFANSTSSSTAPTTLPRATWSTTPACSPASRMSTDRSSASKARPASSRRKTGHAIAASIPSRRRRAWCRRAPRAGCWEFCPDWSA